ncbi:MAG: hypothetical protein DDT22_01297 [candidate division WS2 bacterium]|nr:hypothetical protein [Candidatus Lithacetigena glycinireducens]
MKSKSSLLKKASKSVNIKDTLEIYSEKAGRNIKPESCVKMS